MKNFLLLFLTILPYSHSLIYTSHYSFINDTAVTNAFYLAHLHSEHDVKQNVFRCLTLCNELLDCLTASVSIIGTCRLFKQSAVGSDLTAALNESTVYTKTASRNSPVFATYGQSCANATCDESIGLGCSTSKLCFCKSGYTAIFGDVDPTSPIYNITDNKCFTKINNTQFYFRNFFTGELIYSWGSGYLDVVVTYNTAMNGDPTKLWEFIYFSNGYYYIRNMGNRFVVTLSGFIVHDNFASDPKRRWKFVSNGEGNFIVSSEFDGTHMYDDGTYVNTYDYYFDQNLVSDVWIIIGA